MFAFHGHIWCIQRQRFTTTTSLDSCHVTSTSREVNQSNGVKFFSKSGSYEHMHDPWCVRSLCRFLRFMSHSGSHFPKPRGRGCRCRCRVCVVFTKCVVTWRVCRFQFSRSTPHLYATRSGLWFDNVSMIGFALQIDPFSEAKDSTTLPRMWNKSTCNAMLLELETG